MPPKSIVHTEPKRQAVADARARVKSEKAEQRVKQRRERQAEAEQNQPEPELNSELAPVRKAMEPHGLTPEEQARLIAEGVTTAEIFNRLPDEQFEHSGIDIAARREEKRRRDQAAEDTRYATAVAEESRRYDAAMATEHSRYTAAVAAEETRYDAAVAVEETRYAAAVAEENRRYDTAVAAEQQRHEQALHQQVQALIAQELGSGTAASALKHVASVAALRAFSSSSIQQLGLGIGAYRHAPSVLTSTLIGTDSRCIRLHLCKRAFDCIARGS